MQPVCDLISNMMHRHSRLTFLLIRRRSPFPLSLGSAMPRYKIFLLHPNPGSLLTVFFSKTTHLHDWPNTQKHSHDHEQYQHETAPPSDSPSSTTLLPGSTPAQFPPMKTSILSPPFLPPTPPPSVHNPTYSLIHTPPPASSLLSPPSPPPTPVLVHSRAQAVTKGSAKRKERCNKRERR